MVGFVILRWPGFAGVLQIFRQYFGSGAGAGPDRLIGMFDDRMGTLGKILASEAAPSGRPRF